MQSLDVIKQKSLNLFKIHKLFKLWEYYVNQLFISLNILFWTGDSEYQTENHLFVLLVSNNM